MADYPFVVDVLDASLNLLGEGPVYRSPSLVWTEVLDETGSLEFEAFASDENALNTLLVGRRVRVRGVGWLSRYGIIREITLNPTARSVLVKAIGLLDELSTLPCGQWSYFDTSDINTVVLPAIVAGTGWSLGTVDAGLGNFYGSFENLTRTGALQRLRERGGLHFREGSSTRTLDFGVFGVDSLVRVMNVHHAIAAQDSNADLAVITDVEIQETSDEYLARIYPWGSGEDNGDVNREKVGLFDIPSADPKSANVRVVPGLRGVATTTIAGSAAPDTLKVASTTGFFVYPISQLFIGDTSDLSVSFQYNWYVAEVVDGTTLRVGNSGSPAAYSPPAAGVDVVSFPQYYLQDDTAWSADPVAEHRIFEDVDVLGRPTSTLTQWQSAALALYDRAYSYLQKHKTRQVVYDVTALNVPLTLRVGGTVQFVFRGFARTSAGTYMFIDVDTNLYVLQIQRSFDADNVLSTRLTLSNVDRSVPSNVRTVSRILGVSETLKVKG